MPRSVLALVLLFSLSACGPEADEPAAASSSSDSPPEASAAAETAEDTGAPAAGPIDGAWVQSRVTEARERLAGSVAGRRLWASIEAHGGLSTWLAFGTVSFDFDYQPVGNAARRMHTTSHVDLWRARALQEETEDNPAGVTATLGWDGERAWITPSADAFPSPARFWATTPFYFIGIPFVLADQGTVIEALDDAELDGVAHQLVRITYEDGVGDAPDDYYIVYLHPETHRVAAVRYVVTYPGFFQEGQHSPEKIMRYEEHREVQGLWMPHRFRTHTWERSGGAEGDLVTNVDAGNYRFGESWPAARFSAPEGAVVSESIEVPAAAE